jgi:hypothetical protein
MMTTEEVVTAVVRAATLSVVGRTGATAEAVEMVLVVLVVVDVTPGERAHELPVMQMRSVGQQPPPWVTGQAWSPEGQGRVVWGPVYVLVEVLVDVVITGGVVVVVMTIWVEEAEMVVVTVVTIVTAIATPVEDQH